VRRDTDDGLYDCFNCGLFFTWDQAFRIEPTCPRHGCASTVLEDARLFGDCCDFQIAVAPTYVLAKVKGVRGGAGGIRLTENEFLKTSDRGAPGTSIRLDADAIHTRA
jgi:hypothetical protein